MSRAWNDDASALVWKIVHHQDNLTALLALCLHQGTGRQNNSLVVRLLPTIRHNLEVVEEKARELIDLKPRRREGGRPPKWFELAEDILHFAVSGQKAINDVEGRIKGNYWKIIGTLLTNLLKDCRKQQHNIISAIPKGTRITDTYWIQSTLDILDTIEMGRTNGGRWKREG